MGAFLLYKNIKNANIILAKLTKVSYNKSIEKGNKPK